MRYPRLAVAVVGSHDLPTLRGWWEGRDLDLKQALACSRARTRTCASSATRQRDKRRAAALRCAEQGCCRPTQEPDIPTLARAAHAYLARDTLCAGAWRRSMT